MAYHQTAMHEQQKCAQSLIIPVPKFYKVACLGKSNYWASQFIKPQALYLPVSKTGVWLGVGQYTGYNGTKILGTGPIKWSVPINEGDVGAGFNYNTELKWDRNGATCMQRMFWLQSMYNFAI